MIALSLLEQLTAFAEYGTLSSAAEHLHTSQPALSRSMKHLEEELGVALFVRGKNKLTLNTTGIRAAEYALQVLNASSEFEKRVRDYDRSLHTIAIGFCAPVPQTVLTPIINSLYPGQTLSASMTDDAGFYDELRRGTMNLAVTHECPDDDTFFSKKCGHEDLFISLAPSNALAFYPVLHLNDLDGMSILLLSQIGFWANTHRQKTPNAKYLLQVDPAAFQELAANSAYPAFSSSYYISRGETIPGRMNIPLEDAECHTDYYLVCLKSEVERYSRLFQNVHDKTIL